MKFSNHSRKFRSRHCDSMIQRHEIVDWWIHQLENGGPFAQPQNPARPAGNGSMSCQEARQDRTRAADWWISPSVFVTSTDQAVGISMDFAAFVWKSPWLSTFGSSWKLVDGGLKIHRMRVAVSVRLFKRTIQKDGASFETAQVYDTRL